MRFDRPILTLFCRLAGLFAAPLFAVALLLAVSAGAEVEFARDEVVVETRGGQSFRFSVDLAVTPEQHGHGLMYRESLPVDAGMLFVFRDSQPRSFWMRNTLISLDIIFIREDGTIANIARRTTPLSDASIPSDGPVRGVLEVNGGVTRMLNIEPGDRVLHPAFE